MGYLHISNLYQRTEILLFRECYALEKIHGTSAHVAWKDGKVRLFSGGAKHETFCALFENADLEAHFQAVGHDNVVVYGEAYGGKMQKMKETYGPELLFVAFDVKIDGTWLDVPNANDVATKLGLSFVHWERVPAELDAVNAQRDADSEQAIRNGMGLGHMREGVVLRPIIELTRSNGDRLITKHKRDEFKETATSREVDPEKLQILEEATAIAIEWVTDARLRHVLDKLPQGIGMESTGDLIKAMVEDVIREAAWEIVDSKAARKAIGKRAALLFKEHIKKEAGIT
jgi:hypothetical protein